jgi:hypothetical protein
MRFMTDRSMPPAALHHIVVSVGRVVLCALSWTAAAGPTTAVAGDHDLGAQVAAASGRPSKVGEPAVGFDANALIRLQPSSRGSQTVLTKSGAMLTYDRDAPAARRKGSGQTAASDGGEHSGGVESRLGFSCEAGKRWAIVEGVIQCAAKMGLQPAASAITESGGTLYIRVRLVDGFSTGRVMRLTGDLLQIRVDMFGLDGRVASSCYLTKASPACHLGSPNAAHPELDLQPMFATAGGTRRYAADLASGNLSFAGSLAGGSMQDAYIASVTVSAGQLLVHYAGLHYLSGIQGPNHLRPVYGIGQVGWNTLSEMMGSQSDATWTLTSSWNANVYSTPIVPSRRPWGR